MVLVDPVSLALVVEARKRVSDYLDMPAVVLSGGYLELVPAVELHRISDKTVYDQRKVYRPVSMRHALCFEHLSLWVPTDVAFQLLLEETARAQYSFYFQLVSPSRPLVPFDDPYGAQILRQYFSVHYLAVPVTYVLREIGYPPNFKLCCYKCF